MSHLLIIEDDSMIADPLQKNLRNAGYTVTWCSSLAEARKIESSQFSLIILDWELPDGEGTSFLKELRKKGCETPVIFLTARTDLLYKILGLELGADDYLVKPFEFEELLARIRVRLRTKLAISNKIEMHGIVLDRTAKTVNYKGKNVDLAKMEFSLLMFFMENAGKALVREEILNKVWGYDSFPSSRTIDTHILTLRQKLDDKLIETVRGVGYRFKANE